MKKYIAVKMQILTFNNEDVVRTSGTYTDPADHVLFKDDFE